MRVAAIDVGTNSVHLLVAEVYPDGTLGVVEKAREQVQLGSGGLATRRITPDAFQRGIAALESFKQAADNFNVIDVTAAGTSALREAENGAAFTKAVRERTGIHIRVISGSEEARLIYLGVRASLDFSSGRVLLLDVGGGSTEFILCDTEEAQVLQSVQLGHIRLAEAHHHSDPLTEEEIAEMATVVRDRLRKITTRIHPDDFATLVGSSGAVRCLARMSLVRRGGVPPEHTHGLVLERSDCDRFLARFLKLPRRQYGKIPGMDPRRSNTLPAATVLIREVMSALNKDQLITSEKSLRDGLIVDWVQRHAPEIEVSRTVTDPRRRTVLAVMRRFHVDAHHARQVARFSRALFDGLASLHGLRIDDRRLLEFAALLHDVGHHIAGEDHNKHGAYLIRHTRMYGFTAPEIAVLATIVRYHRGAKPKGSHPEYAGLAPDERRRAKVLAAILRVADALDRSHSQPIQDITVSAETESIRVRAWTDQDANLEHWAAQRRRGLLEQVLNRPVSIEIVSRSEPTAVE